MSVLRVGVPWSRAERESEGRRSRTSFGTARRRTENHARGASAVDPGGSPDPPVSIRKKEKGRRISPPLLRPKRTLCYLFSLCACWLPFFRSPETVRVRPSGQPVIWNVAVSFGASFPPPGSPASVRVKVMVAPGTPLQLPVPVPT